jgi:hypothetical protein
MSMRLKVGLIALVAVVLTATPARADLVYTGSLHAANASASADLGYLSNVFNSFGEYSLTTNVSQRLAVPFTVTGSGPFSITATNGTSPSHPFVGGITGFSSTSSDLGSGSFNYSYLGGTDFTPAGSPPFSGGNTFTEATGMFEYIEASIWSISGGNPLAPQWVTTN